MNLNLNLLRTLVGDVMAHSAPMVQFSTTRPDERLGHWVTLSE